ncbi:MAG: rhomboid family intramembrane serine protease [Deltaproteobacteria bacterium]|nr:rhomboid family intramembrane serine protease [Deltaproteobacteria bacterium]
MAELRHGRLDLPQLGEEPAPPEPEPLLGPVPSRREASEWGLVLQSQGIPYAQEYARQGWVLRVPAGRYDEALASIEAYEKENAQWPPRPVRDVPRHRASLVLPIAFGALGLFFAVTGPPRAGSAWFARGTADAALLASEPWRMVTALTLHADAKHVLGNVIAGGLFGAVVSRRLGPGVALLGVLVAGALGNAANALYHLPEGHRSIGASTAVFAAVGMLAAIQLTIDRRRRDFETRHRWLRRLGPVAGGLALLGSLGASPQSDLWAHLFGFAAGLPVGLALGLAERLRPELTASRRVQLGVGVLAAAGVLVCWQRAVGFG